MRTEQRDQYEAAIRNAAAVLTDIGEEMGMESTTSEVVNDFRLTQSALVYKAAKRRCKHLRRTPAQVAFLSMWRTQLSGYRLDLTCIDCMNRWVDRSGMDPTATYPDTVCEYCHEDTGRVTQMVSQTGSIIVIWYLCDPCVERVDAPPSEEAQAFIELHPDAFTDDLVAFVDSVFGGKP